MPTASAERVGAELRTANPSDRIALRGVRCRAAVAGMSLRATVEQTFVNVEPRAIEAVYTFPLPEAAAVCGFEVVTGDRVLTGQVEEQERAIEKYEEAVSDGHGAYLMEQERPDVFTVRVGNLKPGQAATVRITYVAPLERVDKQIRLSFPTAVAPRYVTATATDALEAVMDGDAVNPPHALHVPYGLSLELEIDLGRPLAGVYSPSHSIQVQRLDGETGRTRVTLAGSVTEMNRDVVLTLDLKKEHEPAVQWSTGPGGASYLAVTFVPEFDESELADPEPVETVFVLDCSGSMQGDSIRQAVVALELCLRSLSAGDAFNVCKFGSTFELMASEPLPYSQQTLDRALKYVRQNKDLGRTELHPPLEAIFNTPPRAGKVRQVILLTDGQVSNEAGVIELARTHRNQNRLFTFGIGAAASAYLVKGLARATGGAAEFITAGERIDEKVLRTFGLLASPMVSDVSIDWGGADVQTLAELPPVFDGDVLAVYGRTPGRAPNAVMLACKTAAGPKQWLVNVPVHPVPDEGAIATMWARRMIQSLEEVNHVNRSRSAAADQKRQRDTLVNLSKEFGLLCSLTTFIAVEHRTLAERNEGKPALRRVPVALAEGWGDVDADLMLAGGAPAVAAAAPMSMAAPAAPMPARRRSLGERMKNALGGMSKAKQEAAARDAAAWNALQKGRYRPAGAAPPPPAAVPPDLDEPLGAYDLEAVGSGSGLLDLTREGGDTHFGAMLGEVTPAPESKAASGHPQDVVPELLAWQQADGSFGGDDRVVNLIQATGFPSDAWLVEVNAALTAFAPGAAVPPAVVRTVLALLFLSVRFADRQPLWQRAYRKATRDHLAKALGRTTRDVETWLSGLARSVASRS